MMPELALVGYDNEDIDCFFTNINCYTPSGSQVSADETITLVFDYLVESVIKNNRKGSWISIVVGGDSTKHPFWLFHF